MLNCCIDLETIKRTGITLRDFQCLALCQGLSVDLEYVYDDDASDDDDDSTNPCATSSDQSSSGLERFRRAVQKTCVEVTSQNIDVDTTNDKDPQHENNGTDQNQHVENDEHDDDGDDGGPLSVLVVSYNRRTLKQTGTGKEHIFFFISKKKS